MAQDLLAFNSFWYGPELDRIAAVCLHSFVEMGHPVTLYAYAPPRGVPAGVRVADAADILPSHSVVMQKRTGSVALFSDRFRYELLHRNCGAWVDCDVLCLRPIPFASYICGYEWPDLINGAILLLPSTSQILAELRGIFTVPRWVPPWHKFTDQIKHKWRYLRVSDYGIADMEHIIAGPRALTHFCNKYGLIGQVAPREVFYPVNWRDLDVFFAPADDINEFLSPESCCIHLWNSKLAPELKNRPVNSGSFIDCVINGSWRDIVKLPHRSAT